jgi:hypothetical protein
MWKQQYKIFTVHTEKSRGFLHVNYKTTGSSTHFRKACFPFPHRTLPVLRSTHICNVTAFRNAVTLQVTDTKLSYHLNFYPVPHGVTVSCMCHTRRFQFCYGS